MKRSPRNILFLCLLVYAQFFGSTTLAHSHENPAATHGTKYTGKFPPLHHCFDDHSHDHGHDHDHDHDHDHEDDHHHHEGEDPEYVTTSKKWSPIVMAVLTETAVFSPACNPIVTPSAALVTRIPSRHFFSSAPSRAPPTV